MTTLLLYACKTGAPEQENIASSRAYPNLKAKQGLFQDFVFQIAVRKEKKLWALLENFDFVTPVKARYMR